MGLEKHLQNSRYISKSCPPPDDILIISNGIKLYGAISIYCVAFYILLLDGRRAFVVAGGKTYGDLMIVNVAFNLVFNTGLLPDAFRA
jgi:hypothetical protein